MIINDVVIGFDSKYAKSLLCLCNIKFHIYVDDFFAYLPNGIFIFVFGTLCLQIIFNDDLYSQILH